MCAGGGRNAGGGVIRGCLGDDVAVDAGAGEDDIREIDLQVLVVGLAIGVCIKRFRIGPFNGAGDGDALRDARLGGNFEGADAISVVRGGIGDVHAGIARRNGIGIADRRRLDLRRVQVVGGELLFQDQRLVLNLRRIGRSIAADFTAGEPRFAFRKSGNGQARHHQDGKSKRQGFFHRVFHGFLLSRAEHIWIISLS